MIKAAAYARFSSSNQREESIDAQLRAIKEYAIKNNISIVKIYTDKAKSATSDKRDQFQQMINDSNFGVFEAVVVHKLDRFSRDKYDSIIYKRKLAKNGIRVMSVTENLDGSPESVILESLLEGLAEYYSKNLARETIKGMLENAYKCKHTGGIPPLGYNVATDKRYVINEEEAKIVREIFSHYIDGYSYNSIISKLNAKGYKTKRGNSFGKNSLHDILANEKYCGNYVFNRTQGKDAFGFRNGHSRKPEDEMIRIEDGMPAIISKEEFAIAREKMNQNRRIAGKYKAKTTYLLSGLIFCGKCGSLMHGNSRKGGRKKERYISYRCSNRTQRKQCDNKEITRSYIEQYVLAELERKLFRDDAIPFLAMKLNEQLNKKKCTNEQERKNIEKQLGNNNKQQKNIIDAISNGYPQDSFKDKLEELSNEKQLLENRLHELMNYDSDFKLTEDSIRKLLSAFKSYVTERNIPECKKFIQNYVEKVVIFDNKVSVTFKIVVNTQIDEPILLPKSTSGKKKLYKSKSKSLSCGA